MPAILKNFYSLHIFWKMATVLVSTYKQILFYGYRRNWKDFLKSRERFSKLYQVLFINKNQAQFMFAHFGACLKKSWFRCTSEHLLLCETKEKVVVMWMLFQSIRLDKNKALAKTFISVLKITVSVSRNNSQLPFNDQTRTSCDAVKFFKAHNSHSQAHYTGWGSFYVINLKKSEHLNWVRTQNTYICFVIKLKSFLSFSLALDTGIH